MRLALLGLNHTTAPLAVRERVALDTARLHDVLAAFRTRFAAAEAVVLSTCNRVEVYTGGPDLPAGALAEFLAGHRGMRAEALRPHVYEKVGRGAIEHLFTVASSLDSMVLGESQILGQVRDAYGLAAGLGLTGPVLNPLFQRALAVGKQVQTDTPLGEGRLSVASVAVDHARRIFDHFGDKAVMCIGAGKMSRLVLKNFAALSPKQLLVCNRDPAKAVALASEFGGQPVAWEALDVKLAGVDIVITSTGSAEAILSAARFAAVHRQRRYRPVFLIDIALPRDIDPAVGEMENVYLYNLDDLQHAVSQTMAGRTEAVTLARAIVKQNVEQYLRSHRARELGPVIDSLYARYNAIADAEVQRTLSKLPNASDAERARLQELARRLVNKLLHDPVTALRAGGSQHAPAEHYLHAMRQLFRLDDLAETPAVEESSSE